MSPVATDQATPDLAAYPHLVLEDLYSPAGSAAYEVIAGKDPLEVREIVALAAQTEGPILDLAAGAGRLTLPLLTLRRPVTALDLSAPMLDILAQKLARLPSSARTRCTIVHADMTSFRLDEEFGVVVLGTTSISLLPDSDARLAAFAAIRAHLAPGGRLLLTTVGVNGANHEPIRISDGGSAYTVFESIDHERARRTMTVIETDGDRTLGYTSSVAILPAATLAEELERSGFVIERTVTATTGAAHYSDTIIVASTGARQP